MKRRKFLQFCGCSIVLVGCGSDSPGTLSNSSSVIPNSPNNSALATLARSSNEAIFDFDAASNLYQVFPLTAQVVRHNGLGAIVWTAGRKGRGPNDLDTPVAVAVDAQQRVWVLDRGLARLQRFDALGQLQGNFLAGVLNLPQDVVVNATRIFISDAGNQRIAIADLNGVLVGEFRDIQINFLRGLALDQGGRIHGVDSGEGLVLIFSPTGTLVARYGGSGPGAGRFRHARGIAIRASDGLIAVADGVEADIEFFSADLVSQGAMPTPGLQPRDLAFGPSGELFVFGDPR